MRTLSVGNHPLRILFLLLMVGLASCSSSVPRWTPESGRVVITVTGPVYDPDSQSSYYLSSKLHKALGYLEIHQEEIFNGGKIRISSPESGTEDGPPEKSTRIVLTNWIVSQEKFLPKWQQLEKEALLDNDRTAELLFDEENEEETRELVVGMKEVTTDTDPRIFLQGYRLITSEDRNEVNWFSIPIEDGKNMTDQILENLVLLVGSEQKASPSFASMGFVKIPAGCIRRTGSDQPASADQTATDEICVDGFLIGKYPVTAGQWQAIMADGQPFAGEKPTAPITRINRADVEAFLEKLNDLTDRQYRLPTEAEWEYACQTGRTERGRPKGNFAGIDSTDRWTGIAPVTGFPSETSGLSDMAGNSWEITDDAFVDANDHQWFFKRWIKGFFSDPEELVVKGGSFDTDRPVDGCALRNRYQSNTRLADVGFRLVLDE